jgi:hypothetical protein
MIYCKNIIFIYLLINYLFISGFSIYLSFNKNNLNIKDLLLSFYFPSFYLFSKLI